MLIRSSQGPTKYSESREALVSIPRYINVSDNNSRVSSATFPGSALLITSREAIIDIQYYSTVSTKSPWLSALSSRRCVITENLQATRQRLLSDFTSGLTILSSWRQHLFYQPQQLSSVLKRRVLYTTWKMHLSGVFRGLSSTLSLSLCTECIILQFSQRTLMRDQIHPLRTSAGVEGRQRLNRDIAPFWWNFCTSSWVFCY